MSEQEKKPDGPRKTRFKKCEKWKRISPATRLECQTMGAFGAYKKVREFLNRTYHDKEFVGVALGMWLKGCKFGNRIAKGYLPEDDFENDTQKS